MQRADVLRALTQDGGRAVEVDLGDAAPLDELAEGLERVRQDTVVVAVIGGSGSFLSIAGVVVVANRFGREVVGVVPVDDGSTTVVLRTTTSDDLLDRAATWDSAARLKATTHERDELQRRLDRILRSRSYRLARRMARAKRSVAGLIHRG